MNIAVFASGSGTNTENIIKYFKESQIGAVKMIFSNKEKAGVIDRAKRLNVPVTCFNKEMINSGELLKILENEDIDFIVLAGYLWLLPPDIIKAYPNKIVNIHPALLPKYGGKGMYGMHVHKAVVDNKEQESGITIHLVNEEYDKGDIVFRATCPVSNSDTPEDVAAKVHKLEYTHYPRIIEELIGGSK